MKTFFSLLLTLAMTTLAFAQGKIRLANDSLHLVYFPTDTSHLPDPALAGQAYVRGMGGMTLTVELWAGTSSAALGLVGSASFAGQGTPGTFPGMNIILPNGFAAGVPAFFQVEVYDVAAGSFTNAVATYSWYGESSMFTAVPGSTAYNVITSHSPTPAAASTWADGTFAVGGSLPGAMGAIALEVRLGPEPSTFALSCLGLALLVLRRRGAAKAKK